MTPAAKTFQCPKCPRIFRTQGALNGHQRSHSFFTFLGKEMPEGFRDRAVTPSERAAKALLDAEMLDDEAFRGLNTEQIVERVAALIDREVGAEAVIAAAVDICEKMADKHEAKEMQARKYEREQDYAAYESVENRAAADALREAAKSIRKLGGENR